MSEYNQLVFCRIVRSKTSVKIMSFSPAGMDNTNTNIFSTVILASYSFLQFVAFWCRIAFIVASDWFVLSI